MDLRSLAAMSLPAQLWPKTPFRSHPRAPVSAPAPVTPWQGQSPAPHNPAWPWAPLSCVDPQLDILAQSWPISRAWPSWLCVCPWFPWLGPTLTHIHGLMSQQCPSVQLPSWGGGMTLAASPALLPMGKADHQGRCPVEAQLRDVSASTYILFYFWQQIMYDRSHVAAHQTIQCCSN